MGQANINVTNRTTLPNVQLSCERPHQAYEVLLTNPNKHSFLSGCWDPRDIILTQGSLGGRSPPIGAEQGPSYYMIYNVKPTLSYQTTRCHKQQQQHQ